MKSNKPFFRSTLWLTAAIIIYYGYQTYHHLNLIVDWDSFWPNLLESLENLCLASVCVCLALYIRRVNQKGLMDARAGKSFYWMSCLFILAASLAYVKTRFFDLGGSFGFAVLVLFSTITYQLYKLTQQAARAKEENDLTI
jgi:hypothetical protein